HVPPGIPDDAAVRRGWRDGWSTSGLRVGYGGYLELLSHFRSEAVGQPPNDLSRLLPGDDSLRRISAAAIGKFVPGTTPHLLPAARLAAGGARFGAGGRLCYHAVRCGAAAEGL